MACLLLAAPAAWLAAWPPAAAPPIRHRRQLHRLPLRPAPTAAAAAPARRTQAGSSGLCCWAARSRRCRSLPAAAPVASSMIRVRRGCSADTDAAVHSSCIRPTKPSRNLQSGSRLPGGRRRAPDCAKRLGQTSSDVSATPLHAAGQASSQIRGQGIGQSLTHRLNVGVDPAHLTVDNCSEARPTSPLCAQCP